MVIIMLVDLATRPIDFFRDALRSSFEDAKHDPTKLETHLDIEYLAKVLNGILVTENFYTSPNGLRRRFGTIAGAYAQLRGPSGRLFLAQNLGDHALVISGLFPKSIDDVKYYEEVGMSGYAVTYALSAHDMPNPLFERLSQKFPFYRKRINYAARNFAYAEKRADESVRMIWAPNAQIH